MTLWGRSKTRPLPVKTVKGADTKELCEILRDRLENGDKATKAEAVAHVTKLHDSFDLDAKTLKDLVQASDLDADDIWPLEYVAIDGDELNTVMRAAAAIVYDFDMDALAEMRRLLAKAHVFSGHALAADGAQLGLIL